MMFWPLTAFCRSVALRKESVDRNAKEFGMRRVLIQSLSARRAWIEMSRRFIVCGATFTVALRKESVDRNLFRLPKKNRLPVALRKESVDRNVYPMISLNACRVALRKESVDRNTSIDNLTQGVFSRSPQGERG